MFFFHYIGNLQVLRLQEQLQAERDLRAALEVGLSLSSGQFSNSHAVSSKVFPMATIPWSTYWIYHMQIYI